jgi:hypothetical protein
MKIVKRGLCPVLGAAVALGSLGVSGCSGDSGSSVAESKGRRDEVQKARLADEGVNLVPAKNKAGRR